MHTANDLTLLVDDLAAHWTESALKILKGAGVQRISVDMEVEAWRTLKKVLRAELRCQRLFRSPPTTLSALRERALHKATLWVARKLEPQAVSGAFEMWIRLLARERTSTAEEGSLYATLVQRPTKRATVQKPSRIEWMPRLRDSAGGG